MGLTAHATAAVTRRVALVIGNGAYQNAPQLDNAPGDAKAMAEALRRLGFEVIDGYDLDFNQMRSKVSEFSAALAKSSSGLVYYAGHGISIDEENYLIPVDVQLHTPADLDFGAISVSVLLKQMKREERVSIIILDACRDNPFAAALARSATRALVSVRGLSRIEGDLARGTLIAFASDPKSVALDGPPGGHSPFAQALLDHLFDPGVSIDTLMTRVREQVWEKTNHNQLPWVNTSLIGEFVLDSSAGNKMPTLTPSAIPSNDKTQEENLLWQSAEHSNLRDDYQAYLEVFPNGVFARMAKNRIAALQDNARVAGSEASKLPSLVQKSSKLDSPSSDAKSGSAPILGMAELSPPVQGPPQSEARSTDAKPGSLPISGAAELSPPVSGLFQSEPPSSDAKLGTAETERTLSLTPSDWKEIQIRLRLIGHYKGAENGAVDGATRSSIANWQQDRHFNPSSFLSLTQLAALKEESESRYQVYLAAHLKVNDGVTRRPVRHIPQSKQETLRHTIETPRYAPKRTLAQQPRLEALPISPGAPAQPSGPRSCDLNSCRGKRNNSLL